MFVPLVIFKAQCPYHTAITPFPLSALITLSPMQLKHFFALLHIPNPPPATSFYACACPTPPKCLFK